LLEDEELEEVVLRVVVFVVVVFGNFDDGFLGAAAHNPEIKNKRTIHTEIVFFILCSRIS
jgi:hypothetical protein